MNPDAIILTALKILAVLVLVALNGFFVAAEFALVRVRETQLDALAAKGWRRAKIAQHIVRNLNKYLSAAQVGITLASLGLGWLGQAVFVDLLQPVFGLVHIASPKIQHTLAFIIGFSTITFLHISVGEQAPKFLAIQKSLPTTLWIAWPLEWFYRLLYPFVIVLNGASQWLLRCVGLDPVSESGRAYSEEELRLLLSAAREYGETGQGREILLNALDLPHRIAREIMRPRREIVAFNTAATMDECLALAEQTRYARFPICDGGDLDKTRGVIHIKDLYPAMLKGGARTAADLLPVARKLLYVPATVRLEKLIQLFRERRLRFAVVVDEYGGTLGIATLENTLEALVGQIQDEFDQGQTIFVRREKNVWDVTGGMPLHELEKITGPLPRDEGVATVSGWVTQRLGGFPKTGDVLAAGACELRVEEMDGTRVARLKIIKRDEPQSPEI